MADDERDLPSDGAQSPPRQRRQRGGSEAEGEIERAADRTVATGRQRLDRTWVEILVTGFFGGTEITIGVLAMLAVYHETGSHLIAGFAFSIGLIILLLAHSELFTEGFLVPVAAVVAKEATVGDLLRLWVGTLVANLIGGWLTMWIAVAAFPKYHDTLVEMGAHYADAGLTFESVALGILAGATITLLTRMQNGTDDAVAQMLSAVAIGFVLTGLQMFHSIFDSLIVFGAIHTGDAPYGYLEWLGFMAYTVPANMVGGLVLVTLLRLVRGRESGVSSS